MPSGTRKRYAIRHAKAICHPARESDMPSGTRKRYAIRHAKAICHPARESDMPSGTRKRYAIRHAKAICHPARESDMPSGTRKRYAIRHTSRSPCLLRIIYEIFTRDSQQLIFHLNSTNTHQRFSQAKRIMIYSWKNLP